jgi:hypothetical protein
MLVPRTRSSHHIAAGTVANFGFKSGTRIIELLVSSSIPKFAQKSRQMLANFGIGTLAPVPRRAIRAAYLPLFFAGRRCRMIMPHGRNATLSWLEHDPERWIPVSGKVMLKQ